MEFQFKKDNPDAKQRRKFCEEILANNEGKLPVILEKGIKEEADLPEIDKTKFLVPNALTVTQFKAMILKRMPIKDKNPEEAFVLLVNAKNLILGEQTMGEIYEKYKDPDDLFLYIAYAKKKIWG